MTLILVSNHKSINESSLSTGHPLTLQTPGPLQDPCELSGGASPYGHDQDGAPDSCTPAPRTQLQLRAGQEQRKRAGSPAEASGAP